MPGPYIIGLLGRAGSGKSTVAKWLTENYDAHVFSFAGPLKALARKLWDLSPQQVYGTQAEKEAIDERYGASARQLLQRLGHGAREELGDGIWVDVCLQRIAAHREKSMMEHKIDPLYVIDDVRYPNEAIAIARSLIGPGFKSRLPGLVVKLVCTDAETSADGSHPSEKGVDEVDERYIATTIRSFRTPESKDLLARVSVFLNNIRPALVDAGSAADPQMRDWCDALDECYRRASYMKERRGR